ncbi:hypothetical protein TSAR_012893 [Trichomalopsis sarcophagae]|uniref:Uncharacterized protein n=1 Tax=Trichomalopsis sarcophagae TaxID=543379 RepID=A0A232F308_9HYME|nr:hypothetical protein TSAR_012893 [Trichomalopsis sarcophagae]
MRNSRKDPSLNFIDRDKRCSFCVSKSKRSHKNKANTIKHSEAENVELPTARSLLAYELKYTACNIEEITTQFNTPQSPPAETRVSINISTQCLRQLTTNRVRGIASPRYLHKNGRMTQTGQLMGLTTIPQTKVTSRMSTNDYVDT